MNQKSSQMDQKTSDQIQNEYYEEMEAYFQQLANELDCSISCATDVWYLRSRSRWTQELEDKLISLHKSGNAPNICEFGHES